MTSTHDTDGMVTVRVPTILRTHTGGASEVSASGGTVAEVLETLDGDYPGIRGRVVDEGGSLRRFVNVYVGDEDVRFADGLATPTPSGTVVSFIPAVAGG
ncbi:MAG: MoaD/ThiS family protein [Actinomycetes bacterium]